MVLSQELEDLTCNICSKDFNRYTYLKIHSRQVHNEDPVSCDECGKELQNKWSLRSHMQSHEMATCEVCNETMKKKVFLTTWRFIKYQELSMNVRNANKVLPEKIVY